MPPFARPKTMPEHGLSSSPRSRVQPPELASRAIRPESGGRSRLWDRSTYFAAAPTAIARQRWAAHPYHIFRVHLTPGPQFRVVLIVYPSIIPAFLTSVLL